MRRTALILAFLATPLALHAQEDTETVDAPAAPAASYIRASDITEAEVYSLADQYDESFWESGAPFGAGAAEWTEIGEVEDVILDPKGAVVGVSVDVGGFLGIGESRVLIPLDDLRLVQVPDDEEYYIVTRLSPEELDEAEEVDGLLVDLDD